MLEFVSERLKRWILKSGKWLALLIMTKHLVTILNDSRQAFSQKKKEKEKRKKKEMGEKR